MAKRETTYTTLNVSSKTLQGKLETLTKAEHEFTTAALEAAVKGGTRAEGDAREGGPVAVRRRLADCSQHDSVGRRRQHGGDLDMTEKVLRHQWSRPYCKRYEHRMHPAKEGTRRFCTNCGMEEFRMRPLRGHVGSHNPPLLYLRFGGGGWERRTLMPECLPVVGEHG